MRSSISTNSGCAPACEMASVVAMKVLRHGEYAIPGLTPAAISAKRSASVPLPTPTQWLTSQNSANAFSKSCTAFPPMNAAVRSAVRKTVTSSSSISK